MHLCKKIFESSQIYKITGKGRSKKSGEKNWAKNDQKIDHFPLVWLILPPDFFVGTQDDWGSVKMGDITDIANILTVTNTIIITNIISIT